MPNPSNAPLPVTEVRNPAGPVLAPRMPHLKALTSVRALAAGYVGIFHMVRPFERWGRMSTFWSAGYTGVSFFFFLSGFILLYTHGPEFASGKGNAKRFWIARFARVYPLYFLVTLLAGILGYKQFHPAYHVVAYVAQLLMVQAWHIRLTPFFNIVSWSLSEEAFFYLLFPFLAARVMPRSIRQGVLWLLGSYLLALLPGLIVMHLDPAAAWSQAAGFSGPHHAVYFVRRFPPLMVGQFLCGLVFGWIYLQRPVTPAFAKAALACGITGLFVLLCCSDHLPFVLLHNGLLIPLYALIVYGLAQPNLVTRALSWSPFVLLGEASYAFYLLHFMLSDTMVLKLGVTDNIRNLLPRFAILVPLSILMHFTVERPGRRYIMQWWDARQARTA